MKITPFRGYAVFVFFFMALMAIAHAVTNATNVVVTTSTTVPLLPVDVPGYWTLGIAIVTPMIIYAVQWIIPNVPPPLLPMLTPLVGVLLGFLINWLGTKNLGWVDMAQAGALAVFVREVFNQNITKPMAVARARKAAAALAPKVTQ